MKNYSQTIIKYAIASVLLLTVVLLFFSYSKNNALQSELQSLNVELTASKEVAKTLNEVGVLMDSIDANRNALRLNLVEGSSHAEYTERMKNLNQYVRETQEKVEELEKSLTKAKSKNSAYLATIKRLKADIETRNTEILALKETVEKYKADNQTLASVTEAQGLDIIQKQEQIETKKRELALLEERIADISHRAKVTEADGYFAQAVAIEETANRTRFAPRKKKETLSQSLELYRKAYELGNTEAKAGIERVGSGLK